MEKHAELSALENQYKDTVNTYRSLIRQGMDKTLETPGEVAQELLDETRALLDKHNAHDAKQSLTKLANHLNTMRSSFTHAKTHIQGELRSLTEFVANIVHTPIHASGSHHALDRDISKDIELARFALQNEAWKSAKESIKSAVDKYISYHQHRLADTVQQKFGDTGIQALDNLQQQGASCRIIKTKDIEKLFQLSNHRNSKVLALGVLAPSNTLKMLFSELSNSQLDITALEDKSDPSAIVLRLGFSRTNTLFIIGISTTPNSDYTAFRALIRHLDACIIDIQNNKLTKSQGDKLLIACFESIKKENVFVTDKSVNSIGSEFQDDTLTELSEIGDEINASSIVNWAKGLI